MKSNGNQKSKNYSQGFLSKEERDRLALSITDEIFKKHKAIGLIKKILEYVSPVKEEEDIYSEYVYAVLKSLNELDPRKSNLSNGKKLVNIIEKKVLQVFTENISYGSTYIERLIYGEGTVSKVTDRKFYANRKILKNFETKSYRTVIPLEDLFTLEERKGDVLEKLILPSYSSKEDYLEQFDNKNFEDENDYEKNKSSVIQELYNIANILNQQK